MTASEEFSTPEEQQDAINQEKRKERNRQIVEAEDWKRLMSTKWGRRLVWGLLSELGVYRSTFSTNALSMAYAEGYRNAGNLLLAKVSTSAPDQYLDMQKEHQDGR